MKPKVHVETTVVSYLTSRPSRDLVTAAHQQITAEWWESRGPGFDLYVSQLVIDEASAGDEEAARRRLDTVKEISLLELNPGAMDLARALVARRAVPERSPEDALHIALATVHGMQFLLTWNCAHIANAEMRAAVSEVCLSHGYEVPLICTPEELMGDRYVEG